MKFPTFAPLFLALGGFVFSQNTPVGLTLLTTFKLPVAVETQPITIPSGFTRVVRYHNGTASGPGLNGTVTGGLAAPKLYPQPDGSLLTRTEATVYGFTTDGEWFITQTSGVLNDVEGFTGGQIYIGGKYTSLSNEYIFTATSVNPNDTLMIATVELYVPFLTF